MTVVDHPLRQLAELNIRIAGEFGQNACWKADLLWDAYLTLEFGARETLIGKHGPVTIGECRVVFDEAGWSVTRSGKALFDSEDLLDGPRRDLAESFVGSQLLRVDWNGALLMVFSGGVTLMFERPADLSEQLFELRLPNGDIVDVFANGTCETESASP